MFKRKQAEEQRKEDENAGTRTRDITRTSGKKSQKEKEEKEQEAARRAEERRQQKDLLKVCSIP